MVTFVVWRGPSTARMMRAAMAKGTPMIAPIQDSSSPMMPMVSKILMVASVSRGQVVMPSRR